MTRKVYARAVPGAGVKGLAGVCVRLSVVAALACAPTAGWALGQVDAALSRTQYDSQVADANGWRVSGAYRLYEWVALELGYVNLGEGAVEGTSARYRVHGITAGARGYWPMGNRWRGVGHLGLYQYQSSMTVLGTRHHNEGSGPYFGVGAEWSVAPPFYVGGEWRRYDVHDINPQVFSLYVGGRF